MLYRKILLRLYSLYSIRYENIIIQKMQISSISLMREYFISLVTL